MNVYSYDEQMAVFFDVITHEIEAIQSIVSKRRGPTSHDDLRHRLSLLTDSMTLHYKYRDLNIPARCYRRISDTQHAQGFIKSKMSLYKRLMRKLNRHIYNNF